LRTHVTILLTVFFFYSSGDHPHLHSFPTRRSSDLAVLTISDSRTLADDRSGDTLVDRLTKAGHILAARDIIRDDKEIIVAHLHRSEEHTSELQSLRHLVCRLLLEKKNSDPMSTRKL